MGQFFDEIPEFLITWIRQQHTFWVATAPLTPTGHINVSPKGLDGTFHIVNASKVWYEDISGSGIETISHLRENGRITVMFNAFEGPPRITRLFGTGTVHEFGTPEYDALLPAEQRQPGSRAVIVIDVYKVGTSCGYAVPFYSFKSHRTQLLEFMAKREAVELEEQEVSPADAPAAKGMRDYWVQKNTKSLDGLPGIVSAHACDKKFVPTKPIVKDVPVGTDGGSLLRGKGLGDYTFIVGFSLGVMVSAVFARLAQQPSFLG